MDRAAPPPPSWPGLGAHRLSAALPRRMGQAILPATILVTLVLELLLAERKYAIFGGGFGQSRALETPGAIAAFFALLGLAHFLLFALAFRLAHRLHKRRAARPIFLYNFLFFGCFLYAAGLFAKFEALSYFSDAMSFQIVRNLGGGSLADAALYVMSEAGLLLLVAGGGAAAYGAGWLALRRLVPERTRIARDIVPSWRSLGLAGAALAAGLFLANGHDELRSALKRFNAPLLANTILHEASDFDRDGYSWFSFPTDPHPLDAGRHPYTLDESAAPDDLAAALPRPAPPIAGARPHVILIVLESARGDMLGKRVGGQPVAPVIEALARRGSFAPEAYSHVGFTTASLQTLFTGAMAPLDDRHSLFRDFARSGYGIGVFSGQAEDFGDTAALTGMRAFADHYIDAQELREERAFSFAALGSLAIDGRILLREFDRHYGRAEAWDRPNFLYFNLQSAHFPYDAPGMDRILGGPPIPRARIAPAEREWVKRTYWNAIAYNDRLVGELLERLDRLGVREDSLIVITADHGESLFDDGFLGHGHAMNAQQTHIPFVMSRPGIALPAPLGLADMRALILRAAGADVPVPAARPVFQYLGTLDRPGAIGMVEAGARWTRRDLGRNRVEVPGVDGSLPLSDLAPDSSAHGAAARLSAHWDRERFIAREAARRPTP